MNIYLLSAIIEIIDLFQALILLLAYGIVLSWIAYWVAKSISKGWREGGNE